MNQWKTILKSESAKEVSLYNNFILDLEEPNFMIENFEFSSIIGSGN